jgi:hypothetical protein
MKILLVGTKLFRADRQTDMVKLIVAFCNFANVPEKGMMDLVGNEIDIQYLELNMLGHIYINLKSTKSHIQHTKCSAVKLNVLV